MARISRFGIEFEGSPSLENPRCASMFLDPRSLKIHLDPVSQTEMSGWVIPENPQATQPIACIFENNSLIACSRANLLRQIPEETKGKRNCGFYMKFPECRNVSQLRLVFLASDDFPGTDSEQVELDRKNALDLDKRWRGAERSQGLTWGVLLEGKSFFIEAGKTFDIMRPQRVLEIGPGYGRLLDAMDELKLVRESYVGLDLSQSRVASLNEQYGDGRTTFICGDARCVDLSDFGSFDLMISSATFEHISPSFVGALNNLKPYLAPGAKIVFDLIDLGDDISNTSVGKGGAFVRVYNSEEIREAIASAGFSFLSQSKYGMNSIETDIDDTKLVRRGTLSLQDDKPVLVHRLMVVASHG